MVCVQGLEREKRFWTGPSYEESRMLTVSHQFGLRQKLVEKI